jgi:hypothetical protein
MATGRTAQQKRAHTGSRPLDDAIFRARAFWVSRSPTYRTLVAATLGGVWAALIAFKRKDLHGAASALGGGEEFGVVAVVVAMLPALALAIALAPSLKDGYPALIGVFILMAYTAGGELGAVRADPGGAPPGPAVEEPTAQPVAQPAEAPVEAPPYAATRPQETADSAWICAPPLVDEALVETFASAHALNRAFRRVRAAGRLILSNAWPEPGTNSNAGWIAFLRHEGKPVGVLTDRDHLALVIAVDDDFAAIGAWLDTTEWRAVVAG